MKHTILLALALAACGGDDSQTTLTVEQLQDPSTCMQCHPKHHDQWSGSMHAYASVDPVFVAMNKRGQRETNNELGTFCVQCHAPMAVALNTTNGTDFDPTKLTPATNGVTCYFCHTVKDVIADHNNGLVIDAQSTTLFGGAENPVKNKAHVGKYDERMDSDKNNSEMCGSCHDVITPKGVALERTFVEWKSTFFSSQAKPELHLTCGACHMPSTPRDVIADDPDANVPTRNYGFHEHLWPAIDQAATAFPNVDVMSGRIQEELDPAVTIVGFNAAGVTGTPPPGGVCVTPDGKVTVRVDTLSVAHAWPSGVAHDRRAWLEVKAFDAGGAVVFTSGITPDGIDPEAVEPVAPAIPMPANGLFYERTYKDAAMTQVAHFFWDVVAEDPKYLLKSPVTLDPNAAGFDHSSTVTFTIGAQQSQVDRVEARVRIRPFSFAMIDDLIASGDLAASYRATIPTLEVLASQVVWTRATALPVTYCNPN